LARVTSVVGFGGIAHALVNTKVRLKTKRRSPIMYTDVIV